RRHPSCRRSLVWAPRLAQGRRRARPVGARPPLARGLRSLRDGAGGGGSRGAAPRPLANAESADARGVAGRDRGGTVRHSGMDGRAVAVCCPAARREPRRDRYARGRRRATGPGDRPPRVLAQGEEVVIASDARMPLLSRALDLAEVEPVLRRLAGWEGAAVRAIRAVRYKPGRRCLIEYDVAQPSSELVTLVGKARARGADRPTFELLRELRRRGFDETAVDGICVPEPIAVVPELGLWLQCKVEGVSATQGLAGANGVALARRLAEAAHKLHVADVPARREHTVADELRILHERLDALAAQWPDLGKGRGGQGGHRLGRLLAAWDRPAAPIPAPPPEPCGIHRDFYPDQVLVAGGRLYLLDFDLYSHGDPALDIGHC